MRLPATPADPVSAALRSRLLRRTRWSFIALCGYLLSQAFTIPVFAIGPSWSVWPTLSDFAAGCLFLTLVSTSLPTSALSTANKTILQGLLILLGGSIVSYVFFLIVFSGFSEQTVGESPRATLGGFQLYRLVEFIIVFWTTARIPLTPERITILKRIVGLVFVVVCAGIGLTYFSIISPSTFVRHLPCGAPQVAGAWHSYAVAQGVGLGTVGYNHGYVALQVLMLVSLLIHLGPGRKIFFTNMLLVVSIVVVFLSGSRAGLAAGLVFAATLLAKRPVGTVLFTVVMAVAAVALPADWLSTVGITVERQLTLTEAYEPENLNGRTYIWKARLAFLNEEPLRWIVGSGFGSMTETGTYAHMLGLTVIGETGLLGLSILVVFVYQVLHCLRWQELGVQPILWVTIAFLVSTLSQETFYPVVAFGHFLGFYLCALAIALRLTSYASDGRAVRAVSLYWHGETARFRLPGLSTGAAFTEGRPRL